MEAMERAELAVSLFEQGYNCAQSVVGAYADKVNMSKEDLIRIASSFGGGMGRLREVCGALTGSFMISGLLSGYVDPENNNQKNMHYKKIQRTATLFEDKYDTIICRELLKLKIKHDYPEASERTRDYYRSRPCAGFIFDAVINLEKIIDEGSLSR